MDAEEIRLLFLDFCKSHRTVISGSDERTVCKLSEILRHHLKEKGRELVQGASRRSVLFSYGSDGTPLLTRAVFSKSQDGNRVVRTAFQSSEFLVERGFLKTVTAQGTPVIMYLQGNPIPLSYGKKAENMLRSMGSFFPLLKSLEHAGVSVHHYVFDRAVCSALGRYARQRHALFHKMQAETGAAGSEGHRQLAAALDWIAITPCSNHDTQNALKWGLAGSLENPEIIKALFIIVSALRHAFDILYGCLTAFVQDNMEFVEEGPETHQDRVCFWTALGAEPNVAEELADLGLRWRDGHLEVFRRHFGDPALVERITFVFFSLCRFRKFSDSRWTSMGPSCRTITALSCLGLREWVDMAMRDPKNSKYYLHGAAGLNRGCMLYAVVCSVVSPVADTVLHELFEDDRLARRALAVREAAVEKVRWVCALGSFTWEMLSGLFSTLR